VQIVHYPLFSEIAPQDFPNYEKKNFRTAWIVGPVMLIELASGLWLFKDAFNFYLLANIVWLGIIWMSTAAIQMPLHRKLAKQYNQRYKRLLVQTNWIRTIFWSLRCGILAYYIIKGYRYASFI
jgi:hypothetical protein